MSKKTLRLWSVLLSVFLVVSMIPTMVFAGSEDPVEILTQPESITASAGEQKDLSVVAENATSYQWQRSSDNGQNWSNIGSTNSNYTNAKTATMTVKVNKTTAGFVYKCVVKNSAGSVSTEIVSVTLLQQLEITAQPNSLTGISGDEKVMKVTATNASSYQWQRSSDDGESWSNIGSSNVNYSNAKTAALTIKINKNTAGFVYRCVVKNSENTVNSEAATVTVILPVVIKTEPKDISSPSGEEKTMSVVAENATSYQWQRSSDNGETWSNIGSTNSNYTNAKTDTMTIKVNKTTAGFVYRCVVKNSAFTEYTKEASVTVAEPVQPLEIREQPQSISGTNGSSKRITVVVDNATSYQWQRSADGESWSNISTTNSNYSGVKTQTVTVKINKNTVAYVYRCVVKNADSSVTTDVVTVSLSQSMDITEQPESISGKSGDEKTMSVAATNATSYQWQRSSDDGATWSNIGTTNSNYSGVKTEELSVKINKNTAAYIYRCVVKNDSGDSLASEVACVELKATVTITFDAKGGLIEGYPTRTESAEANSYIFNDTMISPTRDGYTFTGWCLDPDCQTYMGFSYFVTEDLTLYAAWEEKAGCTVTIDANGGYFNDDSSQTTISFNAGADETIFLTHNFASKIKKDGCAIEGWYLDSACTMRIDILEFTPQRDVTIYARWWEAVNITWDGNGGNICIPIGENTSSYYSSYTTSVLKNGYVDYPFAERDGYVLDGWYFDANCTSEVDFDEFFPKQDWTLYAKWSESVNITWNGNGGIVLGENDSPMYTTAYAKGRILEYPAWAERQGYYFDGWYFDEDCTVRLDYETYIPTADVTFFAKWGTGHIVTWNANGGHFWSGGTTRVDVESGETTIGYYEPQRTGYVFAGWCFDADCTEMVNFDTFFPTEDVTLYAKWVRGATITWDGNGGYVYTGSYCSLWEETVPKGVLYGSCSAKREGYAFDGWYLDPDCTESVEPWEYIVTGDVTFYAGWTDGVTVTWDGHGGYVGGNKNLPVLTETVAKDQTINHYISADRDDFAFDGWYLDPDCTISVDPYDYVASESVTFYAGWADAVYITLNANGGYFWGDSEFTSITNKMPRGNCLGSYLNQPELEDYAFSGWYLDEDCTVGIDVWDYFPETDVTLYAKWSESVNVTWDANGGYLWGSTSWPTYIQTVQKGQPINDSEYAERDGYIFDGWYLDDDCTVSVNTYEYVPYEDVRFYAKWIKANTVTLDATGGSFSSGSYEPYYYREVQCGQPIGEIWMTPERTGYFFDGWYLDADCTVSVDPAEYVPTGDVTLYANWEKGVIVTWDANGGRIGDDRLTLVETERKSNYLGYPTPYRHGYKFEGWYFDADCTSSVDFSEYTVSEDVTFYAKWVLGATITWNANGGRFWSEATSYSMTYYMNQELCDFGDTPYRDGYAFGGWYLDALCTESVDPFSYVPVGDVTFYANWVEGVIITWDANGGEFGEFKYVATQTVAKNQQIDAYYTIPSRSGYIFDGWCVDTDCTSEVDFDTYVATGADTFYARWITGVTVTWDANGGDMWGYNDFPIYTQTVRSGEKLNNSEYATREGYFFDGWYLDAACTESVYTYDYIPTGDVTFYAKWAEGVTVTWVGNGGYIWGNLEHPTYSEMVVKGREIGYTHSISREGYNFEGWYFDEACTEKADPDRYVPTEDISFYAKWSKGVIVTFDANGGEFWEGVNRTSYTLEKNAQYVSFNNTPYRDGFAFVGWYEDLDCTTGADTYSHIYTEDVTFYAKWVEAVTVIWNGNGGYHWNDPDSPTFTQQLSKNRHITDYYGDTTSFTRTGYVFDGWYFDSDCLDKVNFDSFILTEDVTFYAKWSTGFIVTFDANDGLQIGDPGCFSYSYTAALNEIVYPPMVDPEREGYVFAGWYLDPEFAERADFWGTQVVVTGDITLYAKWAEGVTVTWNGNGGYLWGNEEYPTYSRMYCKGQTFDYSESASRDGYMFDGWYFDEECTSAVDFDTYAPTSDVTFYAKWEKGCVVTWDANGGCFWGSEDYPTYTNTFPKDWTIGGSYYEPSNGDLTFAGWYFDAACTEYADVRNYVVTKDVTFYAKWTDYVTVTWDGNGGYYFGGASFFYEYSTQTERNHPVSDILTFVNDGYAFDGWYIDENCTESVDFNTYTVTGDVTFYAKWVEGVTVTWDANDGHFDNMMYYDEYPVTVTPGTAVYPPMEPEREGYIFDGWYLDYECTEPADVSGFIATEDITFYAKWNEGVIISWDCDGGLVEIGEGSWYSVGRTTAGKSQLIECLIPEREGYIFDGWYLENSSTKVDFSSYTTTENVTFYARWIPAND